MDFKDMGRALSKTEGTPMQLKSPDGFNLYAKPSDDEDTWELTVEKTEFPCRFLMVSEHSAPFRMRKAELWKIKMKGQNARDFTEAEEEDFKTVAAGIVGWENIIWDNTQMEHSDVNVVNFLDGYRPAFKDANVFIAEDSNFFKMGSQA